MTAEERARLLASCAVFQGTPEAALVDLAERVEALSLEPGDALIVEGEEDADLFVHATGTLVVSRRDGEGVDVEIDLVEGVEVLGEMQALTGGRRGATVRARTAATALRLEAGEVRRFVTAHPDVVQRIGELARERVRRRRLHRAMGTDDEETRTAIEQVVTWRTLDRGEVLFSRGDASDAVYFLLRGRMVSVRQVQGRPVVLGTILPGESIGETALLDGQVRSASVIADCPCEVGHIARHDYLRIARSHPALLLRVLEVVVERQGRAGRRRDAGGARIITLLPTSRQAPMRRLVRDLLAAMGGSVVHVDRSFVATRLGRDDLVDLHDDDALSLRLTMLLDHLEADHAFVLYEADADDTGWTRRCVQEAQELVLVGQAGASAAPSSVERRVVGKGPESLLPHTTLVIVRPEGTAPRDTAAWLRSRQVGTVLHVRDGNHGDHARLARFLTGRAVGLVLSGGAARGLAGFGVIEAMGELGIPVDAVAGVSSGALVAACHAAGMGVEDLADRVLRPRSALRMMELNLPLVSASSAKGFSHVLRELFGERDLADLPLPCLFISTNLTRATQLVSRRGDLCEHLRASNSMPGIFPPVVIDGDLHVDGAFLNNIPIAELGATVRGGPVIAVDVTPGIEFEHNGASADGVGGVQVLMDKLRRRGTHANMPNVVELLMRSQLLGHVAHVREVEHRASLLLRPDLQEFGLAQHYRAKAIAKAGREQALEPLRRWWVEEGASLVGWS